MLYNVLELDQAALRHARYYVKKLYSLKALYEEQPENSIRQLCETLARLQQTYTWLSECRHTLGDAASLFVSFVHLSNGHYPADFADARNFSTSPCVGRTFFAFVALCSIPHRSVSS